MKMKVFECVPSHKCVLCASKLFEFVVICEVSTCSDLFSLSRTVASVSFLTSCVRNFQRRDRSNSAMETKESHDDLTAKAPRKKLKAKFLLTTGTKKELVDRLSEHQATQKEPVLELTGNVEELKNTLQLGDETIEALKVNCYSKINQSQILAAEGLQQLKLPRHDVNELKYHCFLNKSFLSAKRKRFPSSKFQPQCACSNSTGIYAPFVSKLW